jgi:DNA-binding MarR family transcriptional regulator
VEAATETSKGAAATAEDRDLAVRFGALMLYALGSDGGAVMRAIDETGLGLVQFKTMLALAGDGAEASVNELADQLGISVPSASRTVDELVKRGLVSRTEDPEDRRVRRVALTDDGQELTDEVMAARVAGLEQFAATLSATERRKLEAAVEVMMKRDEIAEVYRSHADRLKGRR